MQGTRVTQHTALALLLAASLRAQNGPAPVAIANKLDTPQARVYVATLLPTCRLDRRTVTRPIASWCTSMTVS